MIGKPGLLIHDIRRSWARLAIQAGVAQKTAMAIGGWRTTTTFLRYVIIDEGDIEQALSKVADATNGKQQSAP